MIEAIEKREAKCHPDLLPTLDLYVKKIKECVMFDGGDVDDLPPFSPALCKREFIKLPFPKIMIEMSGYDTIEQTTRCIMWALCEQHGDSIEIEFFLLFDKNTIVLTGHGSWLFFYHDKDIIVEFTLADFPGMTKLTKSVRIMTGRVIQFLSALNCSNTFLQNNSPSEKIQKKRVRNGKLPFFEYKTLHIKINDVKNKNSSGVGTHASPRVHLRRGYIRKLPSGETTWVQACVVGDRSKGFIQKDYKI